MNSRRTFIEVCSWAGVYSLIHPTSILGQSEFSPINETHKLTILHTNDTHSQIDAFDSGKYNGLGGIQARKTLIDQIRDTEEHVLLLDAGDIFQGTPYFNLFHGELEFKAMSMLGYDAATMGNHDFDLGQDNYAKQSHYANFPIIVSNYNASNTSLEKVIKPYHVVKKGAIKIGIIGCGLDLQGFVPAHHFRELQILNPISESIHWSKILRYDEKCDFIIALSHLGYRYDNKKISSDYMLADLVDEIDLIIGGHTHTFLDCPTVIRKSEKKFVMINQVGYAGINLGRIDLYFHEKTKAVTHLGNELLKCQK